MCPKSSLCYGQSQWRSREVSNPSNYKLISLCFSYMIGLLSQTRWHRFLIFNAFRVPQYSRHVDWRLIGPKTATSNMPQHNSFFNLDRDSWNSTEVQPMHDRRSFPSALVVDDEMYVLGGYDGNDTLRSVECYSFTTLEWTQVTPMCTPRSNAGACVFNNKIYLVGGWDGISLNSVECFDIATQVWQRMPSLPRPTTGVRCCFLSFQSTSEQKQPKNRGSRGHMCIIC